MGIDILTPAEKSGSHPDSFVRRKEMRNFLYRVKDKSIQAPMIKAACAGISVALSITGALAEARNSHQLPNFILLKQQDTA